MTEEKTHTQDKDSTYYLECFIANSGIPPKMGAPLRRAAIRDQVGFKTERDVGLFVIGFISAVKSQTIWEEIN